MAHAPCSYTTKLVAWKWAKDVNLLSGPSTTTTKSATILASTWFNRFSSSGEDSKKLAHRVSYLHLERNSGELLLRMFHVKHTLENENQFVVDLLTTLRLDQFSPLAWCRFF